MRVVTLAGGVGGAKLAHGLQAEIGADLTVIVNTGDDLERHGLLVCPDHDTVMYTLAGIANREWGWGIEGETWSAAEQLATYGEDSWFRLGDRDLAAHIVRTDRLRRGERLTEVCCHLQRSLGVRATILPMADAPCGRASAPTTAGSSSRTTSCAATRSRPCTRCGSTASTPPASRPRPGAAFEDADTVVVAPSNPIVSIGPILAVPGMGEAIAAARRRGATVAAVSGIIGGRALKGPADRMLTSLGHESSALGVARLYAGLVDTFVVDQIDAGLADEVGALGLRVVVTDTVMTDDDARQRLAREILASVR